MTSLLFQKFPDLKNLTLDDYRQAMEEAVADVRERVENIKNSKEAPTFENTVVAISDLFSKTDYVFTILEADLLARFSDEKQDLATNLETEMSNLSKDIFQDATISKRFGDVYGISGSLNLDEDDKAILDSIYRSFEDSGAFVANVDAKNRLKEIDEELTKLAADFSRNVLKAVKANAVLIKDKEMLAGIDESKIITFEKSAKEEGYEGGWLIPAERLLVDELLTQAENRNLRESIFKALAEVGIREPYNNLAILDKMHDLRNEYALIIGYKNYAEFARQDYMLKDINDIHKLLKDIEEKALPKYGEEILRAQEFSIKNGGPEELKVWDVPFWLNKLYDKEFAFNSAAFSKYLSLDNIVKSYIDESSKLFNIEFVKSDEYSKLDEDVITYNIFDKEDGSHIAVLHMDLYARPGVKEGGAWMTELTEIYDDIPHTVFLNMNITKPEAGKPALLDAGQSATLFHEGGHCLQGILGRDVKYRTLKGVLSSPSDYCEIHSMINEYRFLVPENLRSHALHVDTGKAPDDKDIEIFTKTVKFRSGLSDITRLLQNSLFDVTYHETSNKDYKGVDDVHQRATVDSPYADYISSYPLTRFGHLFSGGRSGYAVGYVNYLISDIYSSQGFDRFAGDYYNPESCARLKKFYSRGSGGNPLDLCKDLLGAEASPDALLRHAGVDVKEKKKAKTLNPSM